jgi:hypothetical protein
MHRIAAALVALLLIPAAALASQQGVVVVQKWKMSDKCAQQAQAAFPDFTPEANAKREAKLKECLAAQNLPPREGVPQR